MVHHQKVDAARRNGAGFEYERWFGEVVAAAEHARHPGLKNAAKALLDAMAKYTWRVMPGPKRGGTGGGGGKVDWTLHVTVLVNGTGYHLRLDARRHVYEITRGGAPQVVPSRQGPGAQGVRASR